jgi:surfeit locus 1 family protein
VRRLFTPRWLLSHLFVLAMIVLMVNLGFWQLRRLDQRQAANAEIAAAGKQPSVDLAGLSDTDPLPSDHTAASATGVYLHDRELLIANRSFEGSAGSWLVTPLRLADQRIVAVVRGWVPRVVVAGIDTRPTAAPSGEVTVEGRAFDSVGGGRIGVVDPGELPQLSRMDLERYEEVTGLDVIDRWLELRVQVPAQPGELPVPLPPPPLDEGPHLSYAFQWFFFSAGTAVVYWIILRRTLRSVGDPKPPDLVSRP